MFIRKHKLGLLLAAICLAWVGALKLKSGDVTAQDLVSAKVLSIEGPVEIRRQPGREPVMQQIAFKVEDQLRAGDQIITGRKGRLVLGLSDGSQAVIAPQTTVVIKDLSHTPRTLFNVIKGKTRIQIEKLGGQPNPYRVNTPTAVIAVRGTIFDVLVDGDETEVYLHEGRVEVSNLNTPNQPVFLLAGQKTRIFAQRLPEQPAAFKAGRNDGAFRQTRMAPHDGGQPGHKDNKDNQDNQDNRRVAENNSRPGGRRAGASPDNNQRPDFGRGGQAPNFPGGAGPSNSGASPSNSGSRGGGRRP